VKRSFLFQVSVLPFFLLLAAGSASPSKKEKGDEATATTTSAGSVGKPVAVGDAEWTITEVKNRGSVLAGIESYTKELRSQGQYIEIRAKVKNTGTAEGNFGFAELKLVDADGREFGTIEAGSLYRPNDTSGVMLEKVQASMTREFVEIFEIPAGVTKISLRAVGFGAFGSKKNIDLGPLPPVTAAKPAAAASAAAPAGGAARPKTASAAAPTAPAAPAAPAKASAAAAPAAPAPAAPGAIAPAKGGPATPGASAPPAAKAKR